METTGTTTENHQKTYEKPPETSKKLLGNYGEHYRQSNRKSTDNCRKTTEKPTKNQQETSRKPAGNWRETSGKQAGN
jgi:hypothetical protein